jgi:hypothetical protein
MPSKSLGHVRRGSNGRSCRWGNAKFLRFLGPSARFWRSARVENSQKTVLYLFISTSDDKMVVMATKKKTAAKKPGRSKHKDVMAIASRAKSYFDRDIGGQGECENEPRRDAGLASFQVFLDTYFKNKFDNCFWLPWSNDQREIIAELEKAVRQGAHKPFGMPRGSGKTTISEILAIWAILAGFHDYVVVVGATHEKAIRLLKTIKGHLRKNKLLAKDFPKVCGPIRSLEGRANSAKGQHISGKYTNIEWGKDRLVLPEVEGSIYGGSLIEVSGIESSALRGSKEGTKRPGLVIVDDMQTDESAGSALQCDKIMRIIDGAILGMVGPGEEITVVIPCTVIRQGDVADTLLDRDKSPLWGGKRYRAVYEFPTNRNMWDEYAIMRADEMRAGGDGSRATAWYGEHREEMDAGSIIAWPERHRPDELSAVQSMMNLLYRNKYSFWAEYQLQPLTEDLGGGQLEPGPLEKRVNGLARGIVPQSCTHVTAFIDVQAEILFWVVAAWSEDFTGSIIDYGSFPDQGRNYYAVHDIQRTLGRAFPKAGAEGRIHAALTHLAGALLGKSWEREDQAPFKISRMLVDSRFETPTVKNWCRTTPYSALVMPSMGRSMTASSLPWNQFDRKKSEKIGLHWLIPLLAPGKQAFRTLSIEVNYWKSFIAARFMQTIGDKGALTLFGKRGQDHKMFADHCTSEYFVDTKSLTYGHIVREWKERLGKTENHWWDCTVGCAVAANMLGCSLLGSDKLPPPKPVDYLALYKKAREQDKAKQEAKPSGNQPVDYLALYNAARGNA